MYVVEYERNRPRLTAVRCQVCQRSGPAVRGDAPHAAEAAAARAGWAVTPAGYRCPACRRLPPRGAARE